MSVVADRCVILWSLDGGWEEGGRGGRAASGDEQNEDCSTQSNRIGKKRFFWHEWELECLKWLDAAEVKLDTHFPRTVTNV